MNRTWGQGGAIAFCHVEVRAVYATKECPYNWGRVRPLLYVTPSHCKLWEVQSDAIRHNPGEKLWRRKPNFPAARIFSLIYDQWILRTGCKSPVTVGEYV